ncbi:MAG: FkbM family methyltransferase [Endomicrobia bacterium]|nr:FkbM family methyltransferase [Endomicrobiia bacterium]
MRIKFVQEVIDKIRKKSSKKKEKFEFEKNALINNGFLLEDNILTSPNALKFYNSYQAFYILWEIFVRGDYNIINNKDSIFIDIGMNEAFVTLYYSKKTNIKKVYSFEPFNPTYKSALKNIDLNSGVKPKITTFLCGLGYENEEFEIAYCKEEAGNMSVVKDRLKEIKLTDYADVTMEKVKIRKASEMIFPIIHSHPDEKKILKIDTEGSEFGILKDLDENNLLSKFDIIMLEYHFKSPKELEDRLTNNGFTVFYNNYTESAKVGMLYAIK